MRLAKRDELVRNVNIRIRLFECVRRNNLDPLNSKTFEYVSKLLTNGDDPRKSAKNAARKRTVPRRVGRIARSKTAGVHRQHTAPAAKYRAHKSQRQHAGRDITADMQVQNVEF